MNNTITTFDIIKGLINKEFEYFYQPIISLVTGQICSAEALLRWRRPDGQIILPDSFIPVAEEKDFIAEITQAMYPVLIDDLASFPDVGDSFYVTLNLTAPDFESENLANNINELLLKKGLSPKRLGVEIVESILVPPTPLVMKGISDFHKLGFPVVLNDFGMGRTSLNYLSHLPIAALKISLELVQRLSLTRLDFMVFRHIVGIGHQLYLNVIAEGVESHELYDLTLSTGCTSAQGHYFSKPLPKSEFIEFVNKQRCWKSYPFGIEYLAQIDLIDLRRDIIREALIIYANSDDSIRKRALSRMPLIGTTDDLLNKWFMGNKQEFHDVTEIENLRTANKQFNEIGTRLLSAAENGNTWDNITQLIGELSEQSDEIVRMLQKLANEKLTEHFELQKGKL